jgi:hypothetical protein
VEGTSLAYFILRRLDDVGDQRRWELGATGHGPDGLQLAERIGSEVRAWSAKATISRLWPPIEPGVFNEVDLHKALHPSDDHLLSLYLGSDRRERWSPVTV